MGQAASRSEAAPSAPPSRRQRLSTLFHPQSVTEVRPSNSSTPTFERRPSSFMNPLSRFTSDSDLQARPRSSQYSSSLRRNLSTVSRHIPLRRRTNAASEGTQDDAISSSSELYLEDPRYLLPTVEMPDLDFDVQDFNNEGDPGGRSSLRRSSLRPASSFSDRFSALRPERGIRNMTSSLRRRRRSPLSRDEDQAAMLSRLLSVAAAATAATLMNGDQRAVSEARSISNDGEDGTFESFLRALQSGRIAAALRQNGSDDDSDADGNSTAPLNFFRMFRFGSSGSNGQHGGSRDTSSRASSTAGPSNGANIGEDGLDGRMVPIIIVGIRSISPGSQDDSNMPPFLDALSSFPNALAPSSDVTIDGLMRQPQHGTRITHRRRASMGGLGTFPSNYDSQRHHRNPDRPRPLSTTSDTPSGPRPPPSTPASAGLSAFSSGTTTPTTTTSPSPSLTPQTDMTSRRSSFAPRTSLPALDTPVEEPSTQQRPARQRRRLSESDFSRFGSGSSRRNGVVAPDAPTDSATEGSRSWIIYVLGGSYPENHPILTTPSLFTDSPTYEDMLLLSALLGPAKPPVASESDVASAPGLLTVTGTRGRLVAIPGEGSSESSDISVAIAAEERCLVCLCDFEVGDEARKLINCGHLFHRLCIDQWLTTGRNSCPLCRGQGVEEKPIDTQAGSEFPQPPAATASETPPGSTPNI